MTDREELRERLEDLEEEYHAPSLMDLYRDGTDDTDC